MTDRPDCDLLSALVGRISRRGRVVVRPVLCGDWRIDETGAAAAAFHLVAQGRAWLHRRGAPPQRLDRGDLLFTSGGSWHLLAAGPTLAAATDGDPLAAAAPSTELVCALYRGQDREFERLLDGLPAQLVLRSGEGGEPMARLLALLVAEDPGAAGASLVVEALSDALLVHLLRICLAREVIERGLLAALGDPRLAPVLQALHADPGAPWSLGSLAARAALSRSAFAARFRQRLGVSPVQYLAELRMREAERLLGERALSVAQIGERLGYATEAAFRRAFRRVNGRPPGSVRRAAAGPTRGALSDPG